jgi:hypothetical protein
MWKRVCMLRASESALQGRDCCAGRTATCAAKSAPKALLTSAPPWYTTQSECPNASQRAVPWQPLAESVQGTAEFGSPSSHRRCAAAGGTAVSANRERHSRRGIAGGAARRLCHAKEKALRRRGERRAAAHLRQALGRWAIPQKLRLAQNCLIQLRKTQSNCHSKRLTVEMRRGCPQRVSSRSQPINESAR